MHNDLIPVVLEIAITQQTPQQPSLMFTLEQLNEARGRVKSGADFPILVQDFIRLGVRRYTTWLTDGHSDYEGAEQRLSSPPSHAVQPIAGLLDREHFITRVKHHQQGGSDYPTICDEARAAGVQRWVVDTQAMTCTYYTPSNEVVLLEAIPVP